MVPLYCLHLFGALCRLRYERMPEKPAPQKLGYRKRLPPCPCYHPIFTELDGQHSYAPCPENAVKILLLQASDPIQT